MALISSKGVVFVPACLRWTWLGDFIRLLSLANDRLKRKSEQVSSLLNLLSELHFVDLAQMLHLKLFFDFILAVWRFTADHHLKFILAVVKIVTLA